MKINSDIGTYAPECRALSILIDEYYPDFSQVDKLYFDGEVPEPDVKSTNESSDVVDDEPNHQENSGDSIHSGSGNQTDGTDRKSAFELEREFDNLRKDT